MRPTPPSVASSSRGGEKAQLTDTHHFFIILVTHYFLCAACLGARAWVLMLWCWVVHTFTFYKLCCLSCHSVTSDNLIGSNLDSENHNPSDVVAASLSSRGTPNFSRRDTLISRVRARPFRGQGLIYIYRQGLAHLTGKGSPISKGKGYSISLSRACPSHQ